MNNPILEEGINCISCNNKAVMYLKTKPYCKDHNPKRRYQPIKNNKGGFDLKYYIKKWIFKSIVWIILIAGAVTIITIISN